MAKLDFEHVPDVVEQGVIDSTMSPERREASRKRDARVRHLLEKGEKKGLSREDVQLMLSSLTEIGSISDRQGQKIEFFVRGMKLDLVRRETVDGAKVLEVYIDNELLDTDAKEIISRDLTKKILDLKASIIYRYDELARVMADEIRLDDRNIADIEDADSKQEIVDKAGKLLI